jgi:2-polyprenyl-6-methoxyphenol hydroxylase-like FAD-dependent oxidoreductase
MIDTTTAKQRWLSALWPFVQALTAAATKASTLSFVKSDGKRLGRMKVSNRPGEVEVPRGDLASVLFNASKDRAEYVFGDSIMDIMQRDSGTDVTFERAAPRTFDLVIGADGLHSAVRRRVFGPDKDFLHHLGIYVATVPLGRPASDEQDVQMYNTPGKSVTIHPSTGIALAAFTFRSPALPGFDYRDLAQHKRFLRDAFAGEGWHVPELLDIATAAEDLFFDSVSKVVLKRWSSGRIGLLGDAASCVSLFGEGSSLAMIGASTLASALAEHRHDYSAALKAYEATHRRMVLPKQRNVSAASRLLVPGTRAGLALRNLGLRLSLGVS